MKRIFTDNRRDLLAKTLMDVAKIAIAAGFASQFFFELPVSVRLTAWCLIVLFVISGLFVCPRKEE